VIVQFTVHGTPAPQGSKTRMPNGAMLDGKSADARARFKDWRNDCSAAAADQATLTGCMSGPLAVIVEFRFAMPKSRPKASRVHGVAAKVTAPDLDKLQRALGDSLAAGGLIDNDAHVVEWHATKVEVFESWTGAAVIVRSFDDGVES
jgi:crossover junction endodeoxyribonuclease RusA